MKARGAKGIRYPRSPSCKRCPLDIGNLTGVVSAVAKALSGPPGEYGRKAETNPFFPELTLTQRKRSRKES